MRSWWEICQCEVIKCCFA
uniref:Uncharacterized protein n=1 Tax=Anguilla anguilla TaxID=7936 RepID=A0A0E9T0P6_ANGAN